MQDWADRWLLGDGPSPPCRKATTPRPPVSTASSAPASPPPLSLPATHPSGEPGQTSTEPRPDGTAPISSEVDGVAGAGWSGVRDVVADAGATVLFGYPATGMPGALPPQWGDIPGTMGCTLENRLFRDRLPEFTAEGIAVHGVSTQRPDEQAAFAEAEGITFPLLSDMDLRLAAALSAAHLPRGQAIRPKRLILVVDRLRVVRRCLLSRARHPHGHHAVPDGSPRRHPRPPHALKDAGSDQQLLSWPRVPSAQLQAPQDTGAAFRLGW